MKNTHYHQTLDKKYCLDNLFTNINESLSFLLFLNLGLFFFGCFVFHLFKLDPLVWLKIDCGKKVSQNVLEDGDRFGIRLVKVDPYLHSVAGRIIRLRGHIPKSIDLVTALEISSKDKKGQLLVYLLFVGISFGNLKYESSSFLILFVFPFGLNTFLKEFDRVDFPEGFSNLVAG